MFVGSILTALPNPFFDQGCWLFGHTLPFSEVQTQHPPDAFTAQMYIVHVD